MSSPSSGNRVSSLAAGLRALGDVAAHERAVLDALAERLGSELGGHCSVRLTSADGSRWIGGAVHDADASARAVGERLLQSGDSLADGDELSAVVRSGRVLSPEAGSAHASELLIAFELDCVAILPLRTPTAVLGVVTLGRRKPRIHPYDPEELAYAEALAQYAALLVLSTRATNRLHGALLEARGTRRNLDKLSYVISHDLRAPLRAIDGFCRILVEEHTHQLDDEGRRVAMVIQGNAGKMSRLIDDLLEWLRTGRMALHKRASDLTALARRAADATFASAGNAALVIDVEMLPESECDPRAIQRVFELLLQNAARYTRPREQPRVRIHGKRSETSATYIVEDNGIGFDNRYVDKLFGIFQRLHVAPEAEGNGIGLALVERIVDLHGGSVFAEGEVGRGATFGFTLPLSSCDADSNLASDHDR